jgi:hypothetical protein
MRLKIVDRKYQIGNFFRFEKMKGVVLNGYKIAVHRYELRIYFK